VLGETFGSFFTWPNLAKIKEWCQSRKGRDISAATYDLTFPGLSLRCLVEYRGSHPQRGALAEKLGTALQKLPDGSVTRTRLQLIKIFANIPCMPHRSSWTDEQLVEAVRTSFSIRQVIARLNLVPAGGNYVQIKHAMTRLGLDTTHFKGRGWNKGTRYTLPHVRRQLEDILVTGSNFQSYKLKKRLFEAGMKTPKCELCGWCQVFIDGRIPLELDHINGNRLDNRIENLRVLCPNCHSLQPTHRGKNKKVALRF
jgi:hypothetical protein